MKHFCCRFVANACHFIQILRAYFHIGIDVNCVKEISSSKIHCKFIVIMYITPKFRFFFFRLSSFETFDSKLNNISIEFKCIHSASFYWMIITQIYYNIIDSLIVDFLHTYCPSHYLLMILLIYSNYLISGEMNEM